MSDYIKFILNDKLVSTDRNPALPLLDFLRNQEHLTGTKEGCKEGDCGACTVLVGELIEDTVKYRSINSCLFPLGNTTNTHVVTVEGINDSFLTPVQKAFVDEGATQCGFCTPGFVISLTGFLLNNNNAMMDKAINYIAGNICRCTGYTSIKRVVGKIINDLKGITNKKDHLAYLIESQVIPIYFQDITARIKELIKNQKEISNIDHKKKTFLGGGTDLYVQKPDELFDTNLEFLYNKNLDRILIDKDRCSLGSMVTFEMIKQSPDLEKSIPGISHYLDLVASLPIRNCATIGGNIINASPIGDLTILLLALNSNITFFNGKSRRTIALKKLFKGYKELDKKKNEYLENVSFILPDKNAYINFEKISKRKYLDIASVNSAIVLKTKNHTISEVSLAVGGVAPIPLYLAKTSKYLTGKQISEEIVLGCIEIVQSEINPITDVRGTKEYKRILTNQIIKSHFLKFFPEKFKIEAML